MPRPTTGGSGFAGSADSPLAEAVSVGSGFGSGSAGFAGATAGAAFLAPGRRAPAAIPRPLTSGSGLAGAAGVASAGAADAVSAAGAAAFLAPGRFAPPAIP